MSDTPRKTTRKTAAGSAVGKKSTAKKATARKTADKSPKHKHARLIRDSFTIPEDEYGLLADSKMACLQAGFEIKKSELIRIGIALVHDLSTSQIKKAQRSLQPVKTGRPKKHK